VPPLLGPLIPRIRGTPSRSASRFAASLTAISLAPITTRTDREEARAFRAGSQPENVRGFLVVSAPQIGIMPQRHDDRMTIRACGADDVASADVQKTTVLNDR